MTTPGSRPGLPRDLTSFALASTLFVLLLLGVREALTPPILFLLFAWATWPHRNRTGVRAALYIGASLLGFWFLGMYGGLLTPFIVAMGIAYLISPLVAKLEEKKVSRGIAIAAVVIPILLAGVTLLLVTGPQLMDQAQTIVTKLPDFAHRAVAWADGIGNKLATIPGLSAEQRHFFNDLDGEKFGLMLQTKAQELLSHIGSVGGNLMSSLVSVLGFLAYAIIVPVLSFYLLSDWRNLTAAIRDLVPPSKRDAIFGFLEEYDTSLGKYIRGALLEACVVGVLTTVFLLILGVPSAFLIGVITGLMNLVPFVGFVVAIVPAFIVALTMDDPGTGVLKVLGTFVLVQFIDGNVTGPRIVGNSVGLHPVWIMLALTLAGTFFGFTGLLLAIPLAVLAKMVISRAVANYKKSEIYTG